MPSDLVHSRKGFVLSYRASVLSIIPLSIVEASPAPRQTPSVRPSDVSSLPATTGMKKVSRSRLATRSSTPTLPEPSEKEYDQGVDPDALHIEAIRNILMGSQDTQAKLFALVDFFTQKDIIGMDATPSEEYKTFMKEIQLLAAEHMGNAESFLDYLRHTTGRKYTLTNRILISNSTASRWGSTLDDSFKRVFKETRAVAPRFLSEKGLIFCMPPSHSERLGSSTVVVWHIAQLSDTQEPTVTNTSDDEEAIEGEVEPATI